METNLSVIVKKYSVPVLFFFFGIFLLVAGIKGKQDNMFLMSSVLMFIAGFLSIIYSSGKLKTSRSSVVDVIVVSLLLELMIAFLQQTS